MAKEAGMVGRNERDHKPAFIFGIGVSNLANVDNPGLNIPQNLDNIISLVEHEAMGLELQLEFESNQTSFDLKKTSTTLPFLGIHAPLTQVDLSSGSPEVVKRSITLSQQTIELARTTGADYIVTHLQTVGSWDNLPNRLKLVDRLKYQFEHFLSQVIQSEYHGEILIENLEFPLYPATETEIRECLAWINTLRQNTGVTINMALDVGHLWHTGLLIDENRWRGEVMAPYLDQFSLGLLSFPDYLTQLWRLAAADIRLVHLTGCQITADKHITHGMPLVKRSESVNDRLELDVGKCLSLFKGAGLGSDQPTILLNEAHGYSIQEMIEASRLLKDQMGAYG